MKLFKRLAIGSILMALMVLLCACGPQEDTTDPLSGYSVEVDLPFATSSVQAISTPATLRLSGWLGETVVLTEGDYNELSLGSIGTKVRNLQKRLIELGYMTGTATGTFDQATALAVRQFEENYGRAPSGVASELLQYYLFSDTVKPYSVSAQTTKKATATPLTYRTLQRGDSGEDVKRLQQRLYELGYMTAVNGSYFDVYTETAIKDFESAYNRSRTGIATIELQGYLYSSSARNASVLAKSTPTPTPRPTATPKVIEGYSTLEYGDKGTAVTNLQKRLRELGYMKSKADGIYGDKTVEAVMAFEAAYGHIETGIATAEMQRYLYASDAIRFGTVTPTPTASPTPSSYPTLAYGSTGEDVFRLQRRLIELGYLSGDADGQYGRATQTAVSLFESYHGRTSTGVATSALQQYLYSADARQYVSLATPVPTATPFETMYTELRSGSFGMEVFQLQERLCELGYLQSKPDGYFGTDTEQAVRDFESAYSRVQSGIATSALQTVLYSASAKAAPTIAPTAMPTNTPATYKQLKKGDKGEDVRRLQQRLVELGYLAGTVDGYYGDGTEEAVKAFEAAYGRQKTGIATNELLTVLYSSSAKKNTSGNVAVSFVSLQSGDAGQAVTDLQNRLIQLGYLTGTASGQYDSATVNAVKSFQKVMGLKQTGAATSAMQRELFSSNAKGYSNEKMVDVNRDAYVSSTTANVYASINDSQPMTLLKMGSEVTVLRTRGIWAEVKGSNGSKGYMLLDDLTYKTNDFSGDSIVNVNSQAVITESSVNVYKTASASSQKMTALAKGTYVYWIRSKGDWAEIRNNANNVIGYVYTSQLRIVEDETVTPSVLGYSTLKNGSTGNEVKKLQTRLTELGYFYGDIGGNYLTKTTQAVKNFQKQIGLYPDGVSTPALQDLMYSDWAPRYKAYNQSEDGSYTDMYQGRSDIAVTRLQQKLVEYGYLSKASGVYDTATIKAVKQIQGIMGLQQSDGLASRELQAFLQTRGSAKLKK